MFVHGMCHWLLSPHPRKIQGVVFPRSSRSPTLDGTVALPGLAKVLGIHEEVEWPAAIQNDAAAGVPVGPSGTAQAAWAATPMVAPNSSLYGVVVLATALVTAAATL